MEGPARTHFVQGSAYKQVRASGPDFQRKLGGPEKLSGFEDNSHGSSFYTVIGRQLAQNQSNRSVGRFALTTGKWEFLTSPTIGEGRGAGHWVLLLFRLRSSLNTETSQD